MSADLTCAGPPQLGVFGDYSQIPEHVRGAWVEHNAKTRHPPTRMVDEGVDWIEADGTAWHVYRCPVYGRATEAGP